MCCRIFQTAALASFICVRVVGSSEKNGAPITPTPPPPQHVTALLNDTLISLVLTGKRRIKK